ncbi:hypothetical protein GGF48_006203 [Coemansia sp. RSA 921]|nr:hypothetical protein GGF48_006203 [Coemansia sp. RSA 921]KAJ2197131.1 hypothetical protein IW144_002573 [Coemansia sp. RSA 522]KAJ2222334.1 hypothetical protein IW143_001457 [Coemansia sp. RSA 520]KAJ2280460.1 hypothetical protein GGH14_002353 [Coemansia sp. RSA 370]
MSVEAERGKRADAIEKRLNSGQDSVIDTADEPQSTGTVDAVPAKRGGKRGKFPGSGRSLSGAADQASDASASEASESEADIDEAELEDADSGSDFDEELTEDEEDDAVSSDEDVVAPRGGQGTYNLRTPASKRRLSDASNESDTVDAVSPRTRRRTAVNYSERADDHDDVATGESDDDA